jgi:hypothetical protein
MRYYRLHHHTDVYGHTDINVCERCLVQWRHSELKGYLTDGSFLGDPGLCVFHHTPNPAPETHLCWPECLNFDRATGHCAIDRLVHVYCAHKEKLC